MKHFFSLIFSLILLLLVSCKPETGTDYHVYYLGGQSNMDGYGYVSDLPPELSGEINEVPIFHGNTSHDDSLIDGKGIWTWLRPGHGAGFSSDGIVNSYSDRFGLELSFATTMLELNRKSKIAIIKYSRGGTSIDGDAARGSGSWDPDYKDGEGVNQYDHFLATIKNAFNIEDIDGDGRADRLIPAGILWMQGESDGDVTEEVAARYNNNLKVLMGLIRDALGSGEIPVVIGRISDSGNDPSGLVWEFGDIVREAQEIFVEEDKHAALVTSTDSYSYSDPWHYDSDGFIDLGKQYALRLDSLVKR